MNPPHVPPLDPARRLQLLRLRIAAQRGQLDAQVGAIEARFAGVDRRLAQVRALLHNPVVLAGGMGLLLTLGPRRLVRGTSRALLALGIVRRLLRGVSHGA